MKQVFRTITFYHILHQMKSTTLYQIHTNYALLFIFCFSTKCEELFSSMGILIWKL